ncbi:hypothetical protein YC2023_020197 [Brassica napus]
MVSDCQSYLPVFVPLSSGPLCNRGCRFKLFPSRSYIQRSLPFSSLLLTGTGHNSPGSASDIVGGSAKPVLVPLGLLSYGIISQFATDLRVIHLLHTLASNRQILPIRKYVSPLLPEREGEVGSI